MLKIDGKECNIPTTQNKDSEFLHKDAVRSPEIAAMKEAEIKKRLEKKE